MERYIFISSLCFNTLLFSFNPLFGTPPQTQKVLTHESEPIANETMAVVAFNSPEGWRFAEKEALSPSVKVMVIGKGPSEFPPSINLGTEKFSGTLKQYLNRIKEINASQGIRWKDLGTIHTEAGEASLSQIDTQTQWGEVRMMHVILIKDAIVYILTARCSKRGVPHVLQRDIPLTTIPTF